MFFNNAVNLKSRSNLSQEAVEQKARGRSDECEGNLSREPACKQLKDYSQVVDQVKAHSGCFVVLEYRKEIEEDGSGWLCC